MKPVLIIQNDANEGAGQLSTLLKLRGLEQHIVFGFDTNYERLRVDDYSSLAVLGGAQSAYETDKYAYVRNEIELCQVFMEADKPIAGFCLGAQILACALGGEVVPGPRKEIGWFDLALSDAAASDPLMQDHPKKLLSYHFHGDCIRDVPGCTNLASSALTQHQLFRYGSNVYGFQYHAEVDEPLLEVMCRGNRDYLASNGLDAETIIEEGRQHLPEFERHCRDVLNRWINLSADPFTPRRNLPHGRSAII